MSNTRGIILTQYVTIPRNNTHKDDVVGFFAKKSGELVVYVNGRVASSVMAEGFDMDGDGT